MGWLGSWLGTNGVHVEIQNGNTTLAVTLKDAD